MNAADVTAGLAVPIATFTGLWFWRLRPRRRVSGQPDEAPTEAELAESVVGVHVRLDDLQQQITELGLDWEERDRQLAERISGLIDITAKAAGFDPHASKNATDPAAGSD
jgi:hypothetical protein